MNITFITQDSIKTKSTHNNLDGLTRWPELIELYMKHLNLAGYSIPEDMQESILDVIDNLMLENFNKLSRNDYEDDCVGDCKCSETYDIFK